jgi:hypothetical protein
MAVIRTLLISRLASYVFFFCPTGVGSSNLAFMAKQPAFTFRARADRFHARFIKHLCLGRMQIGTLVFGKLIGHRFDMSTKTWYILAAVKLDVAIFMEVRDKARPLRLVVDVVTNRLIGGSGQVGVLACSNVIAVRRNGLILHRTRSLHADVRF